jgi:hypothetical protein
VCGDGARRALGGNAGLVRRGNRYRFHKIAKVRFISDSRDRRSVSMEPRSVSRSIYSRFGSPILLASLSSFACDAGASGGPILPSRTHSAINSDFHGTCTLGSVTGAVLR